MCVSFEFFGVLICLCEMTLSPKTNFKVDLVVVGPEVPLADGVANALEAAGVKCFGPSKVSSVHRSP